MSSEYVYTMYRVDKFYGTDKQVLANISLSFLPGAKIGVLGPNGAGKSTLMRIMAGIEEPSSGIAELHPGASVGFLQQEPELDPAKDVRGNVEDGVRYLRDLLDRFNTISAGFADEVLLLTRHDLEQRALARAVESEDADLRARQERQPDVFENLGVGRINLPEPLHRVNELRHELTIIAREPGTGNGEPQLRFPAPGSLAPDVIQVSA